MARCFVVTVYKEKSMACICETSSRTTRNYRPCESRTSRPCPNRNRNRNRGRAMAQRNTQPQRHNNRPRGRRNTTVVVKPTAGGVIAATAVGVGLAIIASR